MPRSFLVKKYFSNKRPNYSQLSDRICPIIPTHFPPNVLPKKESDPQFPSYPSLLMWTPAALTFGSVSACIPCPPRPLDLSSQSSSSGEEDHCRTSDPPSPDPTERFQCTHCGKTCSSPGLLSRHQLRQCSASLETIATSVESSGGTAKATFRCKNCPKEYNSLGALKMHIRSHTLPCVCSTCGKAFSRPWLLRGHIRTHTGERPFSCPHCNRAFADRSNLRAHLQTHSQVKKYQCGVCSRTFSRMSLLNKHTHFGCCPST